MSLPIITLIFYFREVGIIFETGVISHFLELTVIKFFVFSILQCLFADSDSITYVNYIPI